MILPTITPHIQLYGPVAEHNVLCWFCEQDPAVYNITDNVFLPCWACQKNLRMRMTFWQKIKDWWVP